MTKPSPFKWFKTSPEIIRLAVKLYVRFPLSLRNVEDLLHERGVEVGQARPLTGHPEEVSGHLISMV
jgi:putative transposase